MSESPTESSAWKTFHEQTDSLFEDLIHSAKESLHHNDRFAWLLQQFGFFNRNQVDQIDRTNLANDLYESACEHLNDLRSHIRELIKTLLLICHAPAADKTTLVAWRHQVSDHRDAITVLLTNNPSLKSFLPAVIRIAWITGRSSAARSLDNGKYLHREIRALVLRKQSSLAQWKHRLPADCPWTLIEILAYDPNDPNDYLHDSFYLPFARPNASGKDER